MDEETIRDILRQVERSNRDAGFYRGFLISVEHRIRCLIDSHRVFAQLEEEDFNELQDLQEGIMHVLREDASHEQQ